MKILQLINAHFSVWFHSWALREIDPLHPDVPAIVLRHHAARNKLQRLYT